MPLCACHGRSDHSVFFPHNLNCVRCLCVIPHHIVYGTSTSIKLLWLLALRLWNTHIYLWHCEDCIACNPCEPPNNGDSSKCLKTTSRATNKLQVKIKKFWLNIYGWNFLDCHETYWFALLMILTSFFFPRLCLLRFFGLFFRLKFRIRLNKSYGKIKISKNSNWTLNDDPRKFEKKTYGGKIR